MSQNKSQTILIFVLIILAINSLRHTIVENNLRAELQSRNIDLKKKNKQLELHQDSLREARAMIAHQDSVWSKHVKEQYDLLVQERKKVNVLTYRYETLKKRPAPHWSNNQLDSLTDAIIH